MKKAFAALSGALAAVLIVTPFELSVVTPSAGHLVGYMIDRHGEWHTRASERPFADDPPPDPCMLDLSAPCE